MRNCIALAAVLAVTASVGFAQTESEPNDVYAAANAMNALPTTLTGGLPGSYGNGVSDDCWSFPAVSGVQYTFVASPVNASGIAPLDLGLQMLDNSGTSIEVKDDNGDNVGETLVWSAPSTGTFYLVVFEGTSTINAIASYSINVTSDTGVDDWIMY